MVLVKDPPLQSLICKGSLTTPPDFTVTIPSFIPLVLFYFLYNKAVAYVMTKFSLLNNLVDFLPVSEVYRVLLPVGLLLGVGIGFLGSFVTIRKHLRA